MSADVPNDPYLELDDEQLARRLVERGGLPRHVAIIMDGNGRWAQRRFLPRAAGHRAGRHSVRAAVHVCSRLGVEALTLYTFSQENFSRPPAEVRALWSFLEEALVVERKELRERGVRLVVSGDVSLLPDRARSALEAAVEFLGDGDGLVLNLALAYGGRQELVRATRVIAQRVQNGEVAIEDLDEDAISRELYQPDLPDPDLVIRTSGEWRLSNFLIWQAAYAEILVSPVFWPDFRERQLLLAIDEYGRRERRFGGLPPTDAVSDPSHDPGMLNPARWKRLLGHRS